MDELFSLPYILIPMMNTYTNCSLYFVKENSEVITYKPNVIDYDRLIRTLEETLNSEFLIRLK